MVFKDINREIKFAPVEKCRIDTEEGKIIIKRGMSIPQAREKEAEEYLKDLLRRKVIRLSDSQWRNPIRFVEKPDGCLRLVCNFMALNNIVRKDSHTIPSMRDVHNATQEYRWFMVIDLKEAYYYIENHDNHKKKTAFEFRGKVYEWNGDGIQK